MKSDAEKNLRLENAKLRAQLEEAEEALRAIRAGEVEALVIEGAAGPQIYTLESATTVSNRLRGEALAQVSDAVIAFDNEGRINFINSAAERQYGIVATDVLGCRVQDVYHYRWLHPGDEENAIKSLADHGEWRGENVLVMPDGREIHVESTVTVVRDNNGKRDGMLAVVRDVTERRRTELARMEANGQLAALSAQLRQTNEQLEQRVIARTAQLRALAAELTQSEERERRRIANILHDNLQQLLFAARLHLDVLRRDEDPKSQRKIHQRVEQLINDSIEMARNLSHELSLVVLHEGGLAEGLTWLAKWMAEHHRLSVRVQTDTVTEPVEANVKVLLFQSARELLFNVIKHSGVDTADVRMSLAPNEQLEIVVSDRGKGFDPSETKIGKANSGGFGLFGIHERLQMFGGRMEVESAPGQGSRFRLFAPLRAPVLPEAPSPGGVAPHAKARGVNGKVPARSKIRLILADDHKIMRAGLSALLERQPELEVVGLASDGEEAIRKVEKLQPDLVIMDVNMPRMNGIESTRRITQAWPNVKVIGLTMHMDASHRDAMCRAGAEKCLVKSGPSQELIRAIRNVIGPPPPLPPVRRRRARRAGVA